MATQFLTGALVSGLFYDDDHISRKDALRNARKQAQVGADRARTDSDRRNGALMRNDPLLVRLLKAYSLVPAPEREAFVGRALAAGRVLP